MLGETAMFTGDAYYLQQNHCVCSPRLGVYQNQLPLAHSLANKIKDQ